MRLLFIFEIKELGHKESQEVQKMTENMIIKVVEPEGRFNILVSVINWK